MQETLTKDRSNQKVALIFLSVLTLLDMIFLIMLCQSGGDRLYDLIFIRYNDSFNDFMNVQAMVLTDDAYAASTYAVYPPLAMMIYRLITVIVPTHEIFLYPTYLNQFTAETYTFLLYTIFTSSILGIIIYATKKGLPITRIWLCVILLFSAPFISMYERGNIILISVIFLFLFACCYDSDKKWVREFGYVCLAISAAIKIYPAIFGILILLEKRYKEAIHCILYGVVLFFVPFLFTGGFGQLVTLLNNIQATSDHYKTTGINYRIDLFSALDTFSLLSGAGPMTNNVLRFGIWGLVMILLGTSVFLAKKKWHRLLALTMIFITAPSFSWQYTVTFLVIPLIFFLDDNEERTPWDYVYMLCFILIFAPIIPRWNVFYMEYLDYATTMYSFLLTLFVFGFTMVLCANSICMIVQKLTKKEVSDNE